MSDMRFFISGSFPPVGKFGKQVYPDGDKKFTDGKEEGEVFKRRKWNGDQIFKNDAGASPAVDDYDFLIALEDDPLVRCHDVFIDVYEVCADGSQQLYFEGKFSLQSATFDREKCTIKVGIKPNDIYECLEENKDKELNILTLTNIIETNAPVVNRWEFADVRDACPATVPPDGTGTWKILYHGCIDGPPEDIVVWFRERRTTLCVGGVATPPAGAGWVLIIDDCATTNTAVWARMPTIPTPPVGEIVKGGCICLPLPAGFCVSTRPPAKVDKTISFATVFAAGTIIGQRNAKLNFFVDPIQLTYRIEDPRYDSTYTWAVDNGASIISGQGTEEVVLEFPSTGVTTIDCQEVSPCETVATPLATTDLDVRTYNTDYTPTDAPDTIGVGEYYDGEILEFTPSYTVGGNAVGSWIVTNATIISETPGFLQIQAGTVGDITVKQRFTFPLHAGGPARTVDGTLLTILNTALPATDPIEGIATICDSSAGQQYWVPAHVGASYVWTVPTGASIVAGQGTDRITVDWGATSGDVEVAATLPISPNLILVARCDGTHDDSWWWEVPSDVLYDRNRLLLEAVEAVVQNACPDIDSLKSDFFQYNPDNPDVINYVTGRQSRVNYLTIAQKSDIIDPTSTEPASLALMTWEQAMQILRAAFDVRHIVDEDGRLCIEHVSFFTEQTGIDLTADPDRYDDFAANQNIYSYDKDNLPQRQRFEAMEAETIEFVGFPLEYLNADGSINPCVGLETVTIAPYNTTFDLEFIQTTPGQIEFEGFVVLSNNFDGADYFVIKENGAITGDELLNGHLSWANLHVNYHEHERPFIEGFQNNVFVTFETVIKTKVQNEFAVPICCADDYDPTKTWVTNLGEGEMENGERDFRNDTITLKLRYP